MKPFLLGDEMKQFYTYLHCRPDGIPFYVGKGFGSRSHHFYNRNKHHKNIVTNYGKENIGIFVFTCDSEDQSLEDEIRQIAQLRREGYALCNQTNGGEGASGAIRTPETRAKLSTLKRGNKNMLGKKHSVETLKKLSAARKGKLGRKGDKLSPEHIAKLRAANLGNKHFLGHTHTQNSRSKISAGNKGKPKSDAHRANLVSAWEKRKGQIS